MSNGTVGNAPLRRNLGVATAALIASGGTLVCCVLPAAMVALGAGAVLAGLVSAVPQLVWLSEHKTWVFGLAFVLLTIAGILLWRARRMPCPTHSDLTRTCTRLRRMTFVLWLVALACSGFGAFFAFVLPLLI